MSNKIEVVLDNIAMVPADVVVLCVNPYGVWNDRVDSAIKSVAPHYYQALKDQLPHYGGTLLNNDKFIIQGNRNDHGGEFDDVAFVIDDPDFPAPTSALVTTGMLYAASLWPSSISIPVIRTGAMAKKFPDVHATLVGFARGVLDFAELHPEVDVKVVVYDDENIKFFLDGHLGTEVKS